MQRAGYVERVLSNGKSQENARDLLRSIDDGYADVDDHFLLPYKVRRHVLEALQSQCAVVLARIYILSIPPVHSFEKKNFYFVRTYAAHPSGRYRITGAKHNTLTTLVSDFKALNK